MMPRSTIENSKAKSDQLRKYATQGTALLISSILSALVTFPAHSNELNMRVSDDSLHGNVTIAEQDAKTAFDVGYFFKDDDDNSVNIFNAGLHAKGQTALGNLPATVGIGIQGNFFKQGGFKGSAIGVGGSLRLNIPDIPGLSIESILHYAPDVLSFGDSDEFRRFSLQSNYRLIETADVSFGYQYLNVGVEKSGSNHTFESGVFLGLQMKF